MSGNLTCLIGQLGSRCFSVPTRLSVREDNFVDFQALANLPEWGDKACYTIGPEGVSRQSWRLVNKEQENYFAADETGHQLSSMRFISITCEQ